MDINPTLPAIDELNATADAKTRAALVSIIATINALDTSNLADYSVTEAKLAARTLVTSLPGSPFNGQECFYQASSMVSTGMVWHLRYDSSISGSYKWSFLGGAPFIITTLALTGPTALADVTWGSIGTDPSVTVPLAGNYIVDNCASITPTAGGTFNLGVKVGATEPTATTNDVYGYTGASAQAVALSQRRLVTGVAASTVLLQRYYHSAGGGVSLSRHSGGLIVTPAQVG